MGLEHIEKHEESQSEKESKVFIRNKQTAFFMGALSWVAVYKEYFWVGNYSRGEGIFQHLRYSANDLILFTTFSSFISRLIEHLALYLVRSVITLWKSQFPKCLKIYENCSDQWNIDFKVTSNTINIPRIFQYSKTPREHA